MKVNKMLIWGGVLVGAWWLWSRMDKDTYPGRTGVKAYGMGRTFWADFMGAK